MEKGILGPHEGKELELMLRGEKQVALFNQELGIPDAFLPYLELGMLHSKTVQRHVNDVCLTDFIVYLPQSLALAEQMEVLLPASTVNGLIPKWNVKSAEFSATEKRTSSTIFSIFKII